MIDIVIRNNNTVLSKYEWNTEISHMDLIYLSIKFQEYLNNPRRYIYPSDTITHLCEFLEIHTILDNTKGKKHFIMDIKTGNGPTVKVIEKHVRNTKIKKKV